MRQIEELNGGVLATWHLRSEKAAVRRIECSFFHKPKVAAETIALIRKMATEYRRLRSRAQSVCGILQPGPTASRDADRTNSSIHSGIQRYHEVIGGAA